MDDAAPSHSIIGEHNPSFLIGQEYPLEGSLIAAANRANTTVDSSMKLNNTILGKKSPKQGATTTITEQQQQPKKRPGVAESLLGYVCLSTVISPFLSQSICF
jgi:hypothetical protein